MRENLRGRLLRRNLGLREDSRAPRQRYQPQDSTAQGHQKVFRKLTENSRGGAGWPVTDEMAGPRNLF